MVRGDPWWYRPILQRECREGRGATVSARQRPTTAGPPVQGPALQGNPKRTRTGRGPHGSIQGKWTQTGRGQRRYYQGSITAEARRGFPGRLSAAPAPHRVRAGLNFCCRQHRHNRPLSGHAAVCVPPTVPSHSWAF
eukprot:gene7423-biopygen10574